MKLLGYLIYRRLRPSIGITLGFIMMYSIIIPALDMKLFMAAIAFFLIALYGDFYNDYRDNYEDVRNNRRDKLTTAGYISPIQSMYVSLILVFIGLSILLFINLIVLLIGLYYSAILFLYSHPRIRLKGSVRGYMTAISFFILLPFGLMYITGVEDVIMTCIFGSFYFFQSGYILCQKDSTDTKDDMNLFIKHGWNRSSEITAVFAILSSISLLMLSFINIYFILIWLLNAGAKCLNVRRIHAKSITRNYRQRMISLEFLTPYLYFIGGIFV